MNFNVCRFLHAWKSAVGSCCQRMQMHANLAECRSVPLRSSLLKIAFVYSVHIQNGFNLFWYTEITVGQLISMLVTVSSVIVKRFCISNVLESLSVAAALHINKALSVFFLWFPGYCTAYNVNNLINSMIDAFESNQNNYYLITGDF